MVQIGESNTEEKPSFAALKKGQSIDTITLEEALELFALPRIVGTMENKDMTVAIGRFGPYVRHDGKFYSLDKTDDPYSITDERCIEIITKKRKENEEKEKLMAILPKTIGEHEGEAITSNIGRFGPYLSYKGKNYKLPKGTNPLDVTLDEAMTIINKPKTTKKK